jgi:hypothetical protein
MARMDPEGALAWHCLLLGLVLAVGAVFTPATAIVVSLIVIAGGTASAIAYYVPIATAERKPWRKKRDRLAAIEWLLVAGLFPVVAALAFQIFGHVALDESRYDLTVTLVAFVGGGLAVIVISGTIDWYVILPVWPECSASRHVGRASRRVGSG